MLNLRKLAKFYMRFYPFGMPYYIEGYNVPRKKNRG